MGCGLGFAKHRQTRFMTDCKKLLADISVQLKYPVIDIMYERVRNSRHLFQTLRTALILLMFCHAARLRSGQLVAVKVQRPNVSRDLHMDAIILRQVAALFQRLLAGPSDLVAIADQLVSAQERGNVDS